MTKEEIFLKIKTHLLTQNKKSIFYRSLTYYYRGNDGLKCAVGCLINDESYPTDLEGKAFYMKMYEIA